MFPARIDDAGTWIEPWVGLMAALVLLLLLAWLRRRLATAIKRRTAPQWVYAEAERLLRSLGFKVIERQPTRRWRLEIDGEGWQTTCRTDLLVERGQRLYVAAVKTGFEASRPHQPSVRRQLLESLLAFRADGALLVDLRRRRVSTVIFGSWCEV